MEAAEVPHRSQYHRAWDAVGSPGGKINLCGIHLTAGSWADCRSGRAGMHHTNIGTHTHIHTLGWGIPCLCLIINRSSVQRFTMCQHQLHSLLSHYPVCSYCVWGVRVWGCRVTKSHYFMHFARCWITKWVRVHKGRHATSGGCGMDGGGWRHAHIDIFRTSET